jgi:hypothetical protein
MLYLSVRFRVEIQGILQYEKLQQVEERLLQISWLAAVFSTLINSIEWNP